MMRGRILALCLAMCAMVGCEADGTVDKAAVKKQDRALKATGDAVKESKRWLPFTEEELSTMKTLLVNHKKGTPICKPPKMTVMQETKAVAGAKRKAAAAATALKDAEVKNHHLRVEKKELKVQVRESMTKIRKLEDLVSEKNVRAMQRELKVLKMVDNQTGKDGKRKEEPKTPTAAKDKYVPFLYLGTRANKTDMFPRLTPERVRNFKNIVGLTFNNQGSMVGIDKAQKSFKFKKRKSTIDKFKREFFVATFNGTNGGDVACSMDYYVRIATRKYCTGGALVQYEHYGENKSTKRGCNEWYMKATTAAGSYFGLDRLGAMVKVNKKCYGADVSAKTKAMKKAAAAKKVAAKSGKAGKARIMAAQKKASKRTIAKKANTTNTTNTTNLPRKRPKLAPQKGEGKGTPNNNKGAGKGKGKGKGKVKGKGKGKGMEKGKGKGKGKEKGKGGGRRGNSAKAGKGGK